MTGRAGDGQAEDFADVADAAPPLDLLLSDAALGIMRRFRPDGSTLRLGLNLVVLILQDNAYGMIRWKQAVDQHPDFGMTFGNPDFVAHAHAYGAGGSRVEATEDLVPVLQSAFERGGVQLVVAPVDYSENTRVLGDELRNRVPTPADT